MPLVTRDVTSPASGKSESSPSHQLASPSQVRVTSTQAQVKSKSSRAQAQVKSSSQIHKSKSSPSPRTYKSKSSPSPRTYESKSSPSHQKTGLESKSELESYISD